MRYRWESMSQVQRIAARLDAEAAMDEVRRPDGSLDGICRIRYTPDCSHDVHWGHLSR